MHHHGKPSPLFADEVRSAPEHSPPPLTTDLVHTLWKYDDSFDLHQGRILVEIVGEVEKNLGEGQQSSSRPPWKVRAS